MFDEVYREKQRMHDKTKYLKELGWHEFDDDGDKICCLIFVMDIDLGYGVFRQGAEGKKLLFHTMKQDEAVEWAVDRARQEIADHEIKQVNREVKKDVS